MTLLLSVGGMPADRARARTVVLMLVGVNRRRGNDGHGLECANSREVRRPPSRREERGAHMRLARSFTALGLILFATRLLAAETATARVASGPPSPGVQADGGPSQGAAGSSASGGAASATASPSADSSASPASAAPTGVSRGAAPGAQAPAQGSAGAAAGPSSASKMRLPRTVLPESNRVSLVLDPDKETFSGRIEIAARASAPVREFQLNARNL